MRKAIFALCAVLVLCAALLLTGIPNRLMAKRYAVRGVDVSAYQGTIDWATLRGNDLRFAFVKATEGSTHVDAQFAANYEGARASGLAVGAYHFFSFSSAAKTQAENFIAAVPYAADALPPVVDIELYGAFKKNPPDAAEVVPQLRELLTLLEDAYGKRPILYATQASHRAYIAGNFEDYPLWIRNVWLPIPRLTGGDWAFWQYTDKARRDGYNGEESHIDMNVFHGTPEELAALRGL